MLSKCLQGTPGSGHEHPTVGAGGREERAFIEQSLYTGIGERGQCGSPLGSMRRQAWVLLPVPAKGR